jgi:hydrogenase nickel incorporation protein HypA/HybF
VHEETLVADLARKLEELSSDPTVARITSVEIWLGALSHLGEGTLRARWPEVVGATKAAGAVLQVERGTDPTDPRAQAVVLARIQIEDSASPGARLPAGSGPA